MEIPLGPDGKPVAVSTREAYGGIVPRDRWRWLDCSSGSVRKGQSRQDAAAASPEAPARNGQGRYGAAGTASITESPSAVILSEQSESKNPLSLREALKLPVEQWSGHVVNDFEATVCPRHPEIPALIADFYRRGASYAAMSGSGSSVFGLFRK